MSKSHNQDNFFGGMFDFNGDGKTDIGEQFLAYKMFEEISKEQDEESDDDTKYESISDWLRRIFS